MVMPSTESTEWRLSSLFGKQTWRSEKTLVQVHSANELRMRSSSCDSLTPWGLYNTCQRAAQLLFLQIRKPFLTKLSLNLASGMNHGALAPQILDLQCASGAVLEVGLDRSRENGLAVSFERTADRFNTSHCVTVSNKG